VNRALRSIVIALVLVIGAGLVLNQVFLRRNTVKAELFTYTELMQKINVRPTLVKTAIIESDRGIKGELTTGQNFDCELGNDMMLRDAALALKDAGAQVTFRNSSSRWWWP
jgi:hypothetical protein